MKSPNHIDYYNIEELLSEEEKLVQNSVRNFVNNKVLPVIEEHYQMATFPREIISQLAELNIFGITLPEEYGCAHMNNMAYGLVMQELERGDSAIRSFVSVQSALVMYPIFQFGSQEQKNKWLPQLAACKKIGCFGLTEPDYGSDPAGMLTKAVKVDGGYKLSGSKMWITNGSIADIAIVWAKLNDRVEGFIVEEDFEGFSSLDMKNKHSLRVSVTSELILDDVFVPEKNRLPKTEGIKSALMCLNQARYGIAWGVVGSMEACYQVALEYSKTRIQFNKPIASYQLTQTKLVDMLTEITKAKLLNWQLAKLKDENKLKYTQVSMAKRNNCQNALKIARTAREILGANGITSEYPIMRHAANLESVITYEGTHEMHTLIIGKDITGIEAYR